MFDKYKELIAGILIIIGMVFLPIIGVNYVAKNICLHKYENSQYNFWGGCKIEYNGKYIPENLYKRAFEKNINVNLLQ